MADHADAARKPAPAAQRSTRATGDARQGRAHLLNARPAVAAQRIAAERLAARPALPRQSNRTGLPDALKAHLEASTRVSLDDVRVRRNSGEPARHGAHAFAQDPAIHLAPGQDRHLAHEAWHIVQQRQGRVARTGRTGSGAALNDDARFEHEANASARGVAVGTTTGAGSAAGVMQRVVIGLEEYQRIDQIPDAWVAAFVADLRDPGAHLYAEDIENYLTAVKPNWAQSVTLANAGNHWNVTFADKAITTAADGDCGVHAIDAVQLGAAAVANGHRASGAKVQAVRNAISQSVAGYAKAVVQTRILAEIRDGDSVAETGFGARLTALLQPIEQQEAKRREAAAAQASATQSGAAQSGGGQPSVGATDSKAAATGASASGDAKQSGKAQTASASDSEHAADFKHAAEGGAAGAKLVTKVEDLTRIGYEIEVGESFLVDDFPGADAFVNVTLLAFAAGEIVVEMLLDDPQPQKGKKTRFQVEFRTAPMRPALITAATGKLVNGAIGAFHANEAFKPGGKPGAGWVLTPAGAAFAQRAGATTPTSFRFKAKPIQHLTSSINLGAFTSLDPKDQALLYVHGAGAKSKLELYSGIAKAVAKGKVADEVDASTTGRNTAKATIKTPIEAMLAAEIANNVKGADALVDLVDRMKLPTSVAIGTSGKRKVGDAIGTATDILASGRYPARQGDAAGGGGYLAVAEKLQPPLFDPRNKDIRVLVEHRTDDIVAAARDVLKGQANPLWEKFLKAIERMDKKR